jgi:ubiquinol-cytochrome c reductase cytochrome c1 subunit
MKTSLKFATLGLALGLGWSQYALAEDTHFIYKMPDVNQRNKASLERGAKYFMNYCSGCHSLGHMRYQQMATGIGLVDDKGKVMDAVLKANLMFTTDKMGDQIDSAMTPEDGKAWFGTNVPDLTLETRIRGPEWVYNYLLSFYPDPKRPMGTNNAVFKDVAMPDVFTGIQGIQVPITRVVGEHAEEIVGFDLVVPGELTPVQFQSAMYDLVNFLSFAADPKKLQRERIGVIVLMFLVIFTVFAYLLKREYWKDVD